MFRRALDSRGFVAVLLAMVTGLVLFYRLPFPEHQLFLEVIASRAPHVLASFEWLYWVSLFSTPYMIYAAILSMLYVFTLKLGRRVTAGQLRPIPIPENGMTCLW